MNKNNIQILVKKSTNPVRLGQPLTFCPIDRCAAILASMFISFRMKRYAILCCACRRSSGHHAAENIV